MTKILANSQGKVLMSTDGAYKCDSVEYLEETKAAVEEYIGTGEDIAYADLADTVASMNSQAKLEVGATTVRYDATHTENIASNDNIRIRGNDGNDYTLSQWNAMFVDAGYDKDNMTIEPVGLRIRANSADEIYMFDRYNEKIYTITGGNSYSKSYLPFVLYMTNYVTSTGSGTDSVTNKSWSVTESGNEYILYEDNTKQSWRINKINPYNSIYSITSQNALELTQSIWAQNEWIRHRRAMPSGVSTNKSDGTMGEIQILNSNGTRASVGEDMYFWIKNDSDILVDTGILAKYSIGNRPGTTSTTPSQSVVDAIYTKQVSLGLNMNGTGINSSTKPNLAQGNKGAEVIAVDGEWKIITPFITSPSTTTTNLTNNVADAPAVYWAVSKGYSLPSDRLLLAIYINKLLITNIIDYLNTVESRSIIEFDNTANTAATLVMPNNSAIYRVNIVSGIIEQIASYTMSCVIGVTLP